MGRGENQLGVGQCICGCLLLLRDQGCRLGEGGGQGWGQAQG